MEARNSRRMNRMAGSNEIVRAVENCGKVERPLRTNLPNWFCHCPLAIRWVTIGLDVVVVNFPSRRSINSSPVRRPKQLLCSKAFRDTESTKSLFVTSVKNSLRSIDIQPPSIEACVRQWTISDSCHCSVIASFFTSLRKDLSQSCRKLSRVQKQNPLYSTKLVPT